MKNAMRRILLGSVVVVGLLASGVCAAAGISMSGNIEAGLANVSAPGTGFLLDNAQLHMKGEASDKVTVMVNNAFSYAPGALAANANNSAAYYSSAKLVGVTGAAGFTFSNTKAVVDLKCTDSVHTWFGHLTVPFGMESMTDRYAMATYYYSTAFTFGNGVGGWTFGTGVGATMKPFFVGNLELALLEGRSAFDATPLHGAVAARWSYDWKGSSMAITPVASVYAGRFAGLASPRDLGYSAGLKAQMGMFAATAEFVSENMQAAGGGTNANQNSIYVEPSVDLSVAKLSAKVDIFSGTGTGTATGINGAVAATHTYKDKFRTRVMYMRTGLSGGTAGHDLRLLFGTEF